MKSKDSMSTEPEAENVTDTRVSRRARLQNGLLPGLIGSHLRRAEQAVYERFQRLVADRGLTPGEFGMLLLIYENEGLSQSDLGKAIRSDRSTMVAIIDRFEERKLVVRTQSPFDRRSHALRLTATGKRMMQELIPLVHEHERNIAKRLSRAEQAQLIELLRKIAV